MRNTNYSASLKWLAMGMLLMTAACGGDTKDTPPTQEYEGGVFSEKNMKATLDGSALTLDVIMGNPDMVELHGTAQVALRSLDDTTIADGKQSFSYSGDISTMTFVLDGLPADITRADLVSYRIDYNLSWNGGQAVGTRSVYDALPKIEVVLFTEDSFDDGGKADYSLFALDPSTSKPLPNAAVEVVLTTSDGQQVSTTATTDEHGKANGSLDVPEDSLGDATLVIRVVGNGNEEIEEIPVKIHRRQKILVTTDKPMYQPSQTIHIRALALKTTDKTPMGNSEIIFEIEDAKGNKIAREIAETDEHGIGSKEIKLAHEVNMGNWTIRAIMDETTTEKNIKVERYTLPKFKTTVTLDKTWYKPGDKGQITGAVKYFFGKPVSGGKVQITLSTFDIDFTPFTTVNANTSADGFFSLNFTVPNYVVGQTLEQGLGMLKADISVTDTAGQEQTLSKAAPIAEGGVEVSLIPESGDLAVGINNQVYVVTTTPNGEAVSAEVAISDSEENALATLTTNENGMGAFEMVPAENDTVLIVTATTADDSVKVTRTLSAGGNTEAILLRADRTIYEVGDTATLEARVGKSLDRIYLDMVKDGKTIALKTLVVADGQVTHSFDIDNSMEGEILASVYYLTNKGHIVRDQKKIYVRTSNELQVTLSAPEASYLPGETATVNVDVQDSNGNGVPAAVGINIVDEAVFALQEVQPGLLKTFFQLAKELAEPRIHVKGPTGSAANYLFEEPNEDDLTYDEKTKVAFAALSDEPQHSIQIDTYKNEVSDMLNVLKPWIASEKSRIRENLNDLSSMGIITWENLEFYVASQFEVGNDLWKKPYTTRVEKETQRVIIQSAGPDERTDTMDDYEFTLTYYDLLYSHEEMMMDGGMENGDANVPMAGGDGGGTTGGGGMDESGGGGTVKVRSYFPETLYVNPAVITGPDGKASFPVEMADSITEWRMTGLASSKDGLLGSGMGGITVFQEFFVDINFPVSITRNDKFSVPVALYNYLDTDQTVSLTVEDSEWIHILGPNTKSLTLSPGEVVGVSFDIQAVSVGFHGLTIVAAGQTLSDAVKRVVEVKPDGKEFVSSISGRFKADPEPGKKVSDSPAQTFNIPDINIDDSQKMLVKVYPGFMSQLVEGMDSMLRLPGG